VSSHESESDLLLVLLVNVTPTRKKPNLDIKFTQKSDFKVFMEGDDSRGQWGPLESVRGKVTTRKLRLSTSVYRVGEIGRVSERNCWSQRANKNIVVYSMSERDLSRAPFCPAQAPSPTRATADNVDGVPLCIVLLIVLHGECEHERSRSQRRFAEPKAQLART